jgi:predicted lipoprotein with Yx(FWY)xxD motif
MRHGLSLNMTKSARKWCSLIVVVFVGLVLAACGSSNGGNSTSSTGNAGPYGGGAAAPTTAATGPAVVMAHTGSAGTYLTDGSGRSLYLFAADSGGKSACNGPCAAAWPPLTSTCAPTAGTGATGSMLTTIKRDDGSTQVVYNGHPLYYYSGDSAAGDTSGQGLNNFGGLWWLVTPAGAAIQK